MSVIHNRPWTHHRKCESYVAYLVTASHFSTTLTNIMYNPKTKYSACEIMHNFALELKVIASYFAGKSLSLMKSLMSVSQ